VIAAAPNELLVDEYELAMADSYVAEGKDSEPVTFELFARELPPDRGYLVAAGLERAVEVLTDLRFGDDALDYLRRARICSPALLARLAEVEFTGALAAVPEGTVVHAREPILRIEGDLLTCQLVETLLLNQVNFQTLIATKASRIVTAAAGRPVVDFGFRRAHGADAGILAARSAYIGGCTATATVAAGYLYGVPTTGTMAHSYILSFPTDVEAFVAFLRHHPERSTLLIDTRDPVAGAHAAVEASRATGIVPQAVRLDSGDLVPLTVEVRRVLDEGGLDETRIVCSGDLDEYRISALLADGALIDGFGVGTALTTSSDAPALGGVYKLVESGGRGVMKGRGPKSNLPGRHQVFRGDDGDLIGLADEDLPGRPLLEPVLSAGARLGAEPPIEEARDRAAEQVAALPEGVRALRDPDTLPPRLSDRLRALEEDLR
jgi:nicotinate phosphoribosyltransferase